MTKNPTAKAPPSYAGTHYMTPNGYAVLEKELHWLLHDERPKIVEVVSWAAGNGDRSENGDYIYNKKRLREIDRRARYLTKKLENTKVVDPKQQQNIDRVFFGAKVTYVREDDTEVTVHLVGDDEADFSKGKINWLSPVGKALLKSEEGDIVKVRLDTAIEEIEILEISYPFGL
ncbi:MAG: transcription elongation factor GreB [Alphaproteobacteria bacterium]|nr:transcription elongation factor GreB [Alphaproteobacteria bacterium]